MKGNQILYVDDEEMNLLLFKLNFKKFFKVKTCGSGPEALDLLNEGLKPDIVVSDMKMPGMTGIEFLEKARELLKDTPFYILTGFEILSEIEKALNEGLIKDYLRKPYDRDKLIEEFSGALPAKSE